MQKKRALSINSGEDVRGKTLRWVCLIIFVVLATRLVQVQVVQADYYQNLAKEEHVKRWELKADRGNIFIKERSGIVPIAINSSVYNLSASPKDMDKADFDEISDSLGRITGIKNDEFKDSLEKSEKRGYVQLAKRLSPEVARKITALKIYGLFLESIPQREYPEGRLASHVMGFVNTEGEGQYGVEQFYDKILAGKSGSLKSLSTADGSPLLLPGDAETVETPTEQGKDLTLSLDRGLQSRLEEMSRSSYEKYGASSVSITVMKAETGKVLAMAGAPDYDPAKYFETEDAEAFKNGNVTDSEELGSIIKVLTMAAAINEGAVNKDTTYNNTGFVKVGDRTIENSTSGHTGVISMTDVIKYSLNTGVVYALNQLGGGDINGVAKDKLYSYFHDKFNFGERTGIDVSGENTGIMYSPKDEEGNAVRYSNMTFGHGMTASPIQAGAALSSVLNGGSYYKPSVVDSIDGEEHKPELLRSGVVNNDTAEQIKFMMSQAGYVPKIGGYRIGAKTGTAQLLENDGTYSKTKERGTAYGFIETGEGTFVVVIKVEAPTLDYTHFAGTKTAVPILQDSINWLINYYQPKKLGGTSD
jgi:stage V sporulation protein D (sporulation-specific penicillin-binding protein)